MCPAVLAPAGILDKVVMKVSIVQLSGEIFEVDVEPSASVRELQRRAYGVQRGHIRRASRCGRCPKCASRVAWVTSLFRCALRCDPNSASRVATWLRDPSSLDSCVFSLKFSNVPELSLARTAQASSQPIPAQPGPAQPPDRNPDPDPDPDPDCMVQI